MLSASEVFGRPRVAATEPLSREVLTTAIPLLRNRDGDTSLLIEQSSILLIERDEQLRAMKAVLSEALSLAHAQHLEIRRLSARAAALLEEREAQRQGRGSLQVQEQRQHKLLTETPTSTPSGRTTPTTSALQITRASTRHCARET